jgi:hypothetical protein
MSTPSTHPDYVSIKSQSIDISALPGIDMLRKRDFHNTSAKHVKRGVLSITYRAVCARVDFGVASTVLGAVRESIL